MNKSGDISGRIFGVLTVFTSTVIFAIEFEDQGPSDHCLQVRIYFHLYFKPLALFTSPDIFPAAFCTTDNTYKCAYILLRIFETLKVCTSPDIFLAGLLEY